MAREYVLKGGDGVISVTSNVAPGAVAAVMRAGLAGDAKKAAALDAPLASLHRDLFCEANPIPAPRRAVLSSRSLVSGETPLSLSVPRRAPRALPL